MRRLLSGVTGAATCAASLISMIAGNAMAQQPPPPAAPPPSAAPSAAPVPPAPAAPAPTVAPAPAQPPAPAPQPVQPAAPPPPPPEQAVPAPATAPPAPAAPVAPPAEPAAESAARAEPQVAAQADASTTLQPPPVEGIALQPPPEEPASPAVADEVPWYSKLEASAFIDTYFSFNFQTPKPQQGRNRFRAYDTANGFAVAWAGLDLSYGDDTFGGTLNLRFGPSADALAGDDADAGLQNVKQAYGSWTPGGAGSLVTLDLGKFDTIYGAEVAESQLNFNYTRGLLYWLGQPAFHTGLRANFDVSDQFWITALVANGWNNSVDNNIGKSFGIQFNAAVPGGDEKLFDAHLGYYVGPESVDYGVIPDYCDAASGQTFDPATRTCSTALDGSSVDLARDAGDANSEMRHLIDLVIGVNPTPSFGLLFNADIGFDPVRKGPLSVPDLAGFETQSWWGVSLAGRYQFSDEFAAALRAEIYSDPDGRATAGDDPYIVDVEDLMLYSVTLTLDYAPVPNLLLRWDNRIDLGSDGVFQRQVRTYEKLQATSTLGLVVMTN